MKKLTYIMLLCATVVLSFLACSDDDEERISITSISLNQNKADLKVGDELTLNFTCTPEDIIPQTIWKSSDESIATVDNQGKVSALKQGNAVISLKGIYGTNSVEDKCQITVTNIEADSITLSEAEKDLLIGETFTLTFSVLPENTTDKSVEWGVDNDAIVTVEDGVVTALEPGLAKVSVTLKGTTVSDTCRVKVAPIEMTEIELNATSVEIALGETFELSATILPENTTDKTLVWTSSNPAVASVENGVVTAREEGTCEITASNTNGDVKSSCQVTTFSRKVTDITLSESNIELEINRTHTLVATILPDNATDKTLVWTSSNSSVASVENGVVTAYAEGTCTIEVASADGNAKTGCEVTVVPVKVSGVYLSVPSSLLVGEKADISYEVYPSDAANKNVTISSSDENVAKIEDNMLVGVGVGTTTVTITTEDGQFTQSASVSVVEITSRIRISISFSGTIINGFHSGKLFSSVTNTSNQDITLTRMEIRDSSNNRLVVYTEDESMLGVVSAGGTSSSIGTSTLSQVYNPKIIWFFTYNGKEYQVSAIKN